MKWIEDILFEIDSQGLIDIDLATQKLGEYVKSNFISLDAHSQKITELSSSHQLNLKRARLIDALENMGATDSEYLCDKAIALSQFDQSGKLTNKDEVATKLKADYSGLFKQVDIQGVTPVQTDSGAVELTREQFDKMDYKERVSLFESSPEIYQSFVK